MPAFEDFDDDALGVDDIPTKPKHGSEQTAALPDGDYDVRITGGVLKDAGGSDIFSFLGTVLTDGPYKGWKCERTVFLSKKSGTDEEKKAFKVSKIGEILADFKTIGFDVENWTKANGRPRGEQMKVACNVMVGVCVKVRKSHKNNFTNVYINKRLANLDGMSPTFGEAEMAAGATAGSPPAGDTMPDGSAVPF